MKSLTAPDGTIWKVDIQSPGSSNAMIIFRHPDGRTSRLDRYNWVINQGAGIAQRHVAPRAREGARITG